MYQKPDYLEDDSTFVTKIERDSNICNSCYRKIREHYATVNDLAGPVTEYEDDVEFAYFDDFVNTGRPNAHKPYCVCGAVDWQDIRMRPIEPDEMIEIGHRLSSHLDDKDVVHSKEVLIEYIEMHYQLPSYQDREELVFEEAIEEAKPSEDNSGNDSKVVTA